LADRVVEVPPDADRIVTSSDVSPAVTRTVTRDRQT